MKRLLFFIISILIFNFTTHPLFAQETPNFFSVSYNLIYELNSNGKVYVKQKGLLTNLTSEKYISFIDINFPATHIENISAYDDYGPINPQVINKEGKTSIRLNFNKNLLGIGKNLPFTMEYQYPNIATKRNQQWSLTIPKADASQEVVAYNVTVIIAPDMGHLTKAVPPPAAGLNWQKDQLVDGLKLTIAKPTPIIPKINAQTNTTSFFPIIVGKLKAFSLSILIIFIALAVIIIRKLHK